jgi:regulator of CtrA degradation
MIDTGNNQASTVNLAERRVFSESFRPLYAEGMGLVEETASYLDGDGRADAKGLDRNAASLYAAESMRLTTRLMQIASWLLLQRAANSGEMTREQVTTEKAKVRLDTGSVQDTAESWGELPETFRDLVARSMSLQTRVRRMDEEIYGNGRMSAVDSLSVANPVSDQLMLLQTAFGRS